MKTYLVTYIGNASRFKNLSEEVEANSEREAIELVYQDKLDDNYFPQDDGSIKDCDGHTVAEAYDISIEYDGGRFNAELIEED